MLISIIIATFNASKTLKCCLDSICSQLTNQCELIIIDGGSSDTTNQIISSYDPKVTYTISEPDHGIYDAWNKGILHTHGDWVMFIGADDLLLPDALNSYLELINNIDMSGYDYICANNEYIDKSGKLLKVIGAPAEWKVMRRTMSAAHVASLHRKTLFDEVGFYNLNYKICADYELLLRKGAALKAYFLPKHIARMEVGGMSFSTKAIIETYKLRKEHHSVFAFINIFLFLRDWIAFYLFIFRKTLIGRKL